MMQWFRMYGEFANDPKVQMLSEADQRRYIMLLCLKCSNGDVTLQDCEVTFQLRITSNEWVQTKARLMAKGLIDEANQPTKWDKRQYLSDSSAARVSKHREKKKQACNVTVTPPESETDTEAEKRQNQNQKEKLEASINPTPKMEVLKPTVSFDYRVQNFLTDSGIEAARHAADGWDVYNLMEVYNAGIKSGGMEKPRNADRAFPAWCRVYTKEGRPA
jgi:hypothetical protein